MLETPANAENLRDHGLQFPPQWSGTGTSGLLSNEAIQKKTVRFGSLDPAHVTVAKKSILSAVVVLTLALCVLLSGHHLSVEFYALGLGTFLIAARVFSPFDLGKGTRSGRMHKLVSRVLLEWSCVVGVLVFLAVSFKLAHVFARNIILSWFAATPIALLLTDSLRYPVAKWLASGKGIVHRYIIIGANDVGVELAGVWNKVTPAVSSVVFWITEAPTDYSNCPSSRLPAVARRAIWPILYAAIRSAGFALHCPFPPHRGSKSCSGNCATRQLPFISCRTSSLSISCKYGVSKSTGCRHSLSATRPYKE